MKVKILIIIIHSQPLLEEEKQRSQASPVTNYSYLSSRAEIPTSNTHTCNALTMSSSSNKRPLAVISLLSSDNEANETNNTSNTATTTKDATAPKPKKSRQSKTTTTTPAADEFWPGADLVLLETVVDSQPYFRPASSKPWEEVAESVARWAVVKRPRRPVPNWTARSVRDRVEYLIKEYKKQMRRASHGYEEEKYGKKERLLDSVIEQKEDGMMYSEEEWADMVESRKVGEELRNRSLQRMMMNANKQE